MAQDDTQHMGQHTRLRVRAAVLVVVAGIAVSMMTGLPAAAATEPPDPAPPPAFHGIDAPTPQARQSAGPPALVRRMARVLPTLRRMPVGTTVERVPRGNGERCPGVRARGPQAVASVVRSFELPGNESLFVQVVAFERPRRAQRALVTWFRQNLRDCRRFQIDDFTFVNRRTRPPVFRIGDSRRAYRTRIVYNDPVFGRLHAAERVTAAYREGRYLLLAGSTGVLEFLGDTPKPNFARWADSVEYMYDRADRLPR